MTPGELLEQRMSQDKVDMERAFRSEWNAVNRRFGPQTGNPRIEEARTRTLNTLHGTYRARADKLLNSYGEKQRGFSEIDQMAEEGMISVDPGEIKMRMLVGPEIEKALYQKEESFEGIEQRRGKVRSELDRFDIGRMEGDEFTTEPEMREGYDRPWAPWPFKGQRRVPSLAGGIFVREPVREWDAKKGREVEGVKHRPATQEEMRYYAELKQADVEAARLQTAALRSRRMLNRGQGTFAAKAVLAGPKKLTVHLAREYLQQYGNRADAMAAAERDGYVE